MFGVSQQVPPHDIQSQECWLKSPVGSESCARTVPGAGAPASRVSNASTFSASSSSFSLRMTASTQQGDQQAHEGSRPVAKHMLTQELPQVFQWKSVSMQYWLAGSEHGFTYGSMVT